MCLLLSNLFCRQSPNLVYINWRHAKWWFLQGQGDYSLDKRVIVDRKRIKEVFWGQLVLNDLLSSLRECPFLPNGTVGEFGTFCINAIVL